MLMYQYRPAGRLPQNPEPPASHYRSHFQSTIPAARAGFMIERLAFPRWIACNAIE
jgi:hypothetical protein